MATHSLTKQRFRAAEPLDLEFYGVKMRVAMIDGQNITIEDADLDVDEARALRDWLNKVLPESSDEPTRKQALDDLVRLSEEVGGYDLPVQSSEPTRDLTSSEAASFERTRARSPRRIEPTQKSGADQAQCARCGGIGEHQPWCHTYP